MACTGLAPLDIRRFDALCWLVCAQPRVGAIDACVGATQTILRLTLLVGMVRC
jgi:hypothetical protein